MKRFYKAAGAEKLDGGWQVTLDGRPVKTPARAALIVPSAALADAIVAEWNAQNDRVDPRAMPMTGLSNAAIDHVGGGRRAFVDSLAAYGESDLVCYRAPSPSDLAARQSAAWDPVLTWAEDELGAALQVTTAISHVAQDAAALQRLRTALDAMGDFEIAAMQPLVTIAGSLVIALALARGRIDADAAFAASHLDEQYQFEKWGADAEALATREARQAAFNAAAGFLKLL